MPISHPDPSRRLLLQAIPTGIALSALMPLVGVTALIRPAVSAGYAPLSRHDSGISGILPASRIPASETELQATGIHVHVDGHIAEDAAGLHDLDLTLYHHVTPPSGESISCLVWQYSNKLVANQSSALGFLAPLTEGKLELSLHGRIGDSYDARRVEWIQSMCLSLASVEQALSLRSGTYFLPLLDGIGCQESDWHAFLCEQRRTTDSTETRITDSIGKEPRFSYLQLSIEPPGR